MGQGHIVNEKLSYYVTLHVIGRKKSTKFKTLLHKLCCN